jgi:hypothetical protein
MNDDNGNSAVAACSQNGAVVKQSDKFDRAISALVGLPGVTQTTATTVRTTSPLAGGAQTFIVQTFRQRDRDVEDLPSKFTVFLEHVDDSGCVRLVIPPDVVKVIVRQREALNDRARKRSAKRVAADRKARGIRPAFLKKKGASK